MLSRVKVFFPLFLRKLMSFFKLEKTLKMSQLNIKFPHPRLRSISLININVNTSDFNKLVNILHQLKMSRTTIQNREDLLLPFRLRPDRSCQCLSVNGLSGY